MRRYFSNTRLPRRFLLFIIFILLPLQINADTVLQSFKGSTEKGIYKTEFIEFDYAKSGDKKPELNTVEGSLHSRVLLKPKSKSNLEVFRSYQQTFKKAGFNILHAGTPKKDNPKILAKTLNNNNGLSKRKFTGTGSQVSASDLDRIRLFGEYYLSAVKNTSDATLYAVVVLSSERDLYLIDELTATKMEQDTVTLNLDAMRSAIADTGKIAVYDIYFETGSAKITNRSDHALKTISDYLKQDKHNYYIVGHTDDTGSLKNNLKLSKQRADAITKTLMKKFGITSGRLQARGVGPLSPASNNTSVAGKKLNRRVEIVRRLN
ncbi:MAG: OmpA family protein [Gammaproteobacteria bacterium]|nr:OmpA family protein [Gammaproteobacteria bacterium]